VILGELGAAELRHSKTLSAADCAQGEKRCIVIRQYSQNSCTSKGRYAIALKVRRRLTVLIEIVPRRSRTLVDAARRIQRHLGTLIEMDIFGGAQQDLTTSKTRGDLSAQKLTVPRLHKTSHRDLLYLIRAVGWSQSESYLCWRPPRLSNAEPSANSTRLSATSMTRYIMVLCKSPP
jgi:hypothetical protein